VGPVAVGQWVGMRSSGAANRRKRNALNRRQQNRLKRTQASREGYQVHRKRFPTILEPYVSGAVLACHVEGTIVLPTNFHVGRRVSNINKLLISNESSTTGVACVSNKTVEEMFPQDGVSNQTINAADEPTTDGCTNTFTTKKPTQPCYIRQNVWHKQMGTHIANLQVLGKAPSDGCTVVHVLSQRELDEMVEHGAQVIHLHKPKRDQASNNISWEVCSQ